MDLPYQKSHSSFSTQISGWPGHNVVPLVVRVFSFYPFASWLRLWGFSSFCAEPTHFWVPVGHRWSAGAGSQSDPRCSGSLPQAGERSWAAAGPRGLCHKCWEHLTTQQSPGAVCPAGVQGKEALEKWKPKELVASGSRIPSLTKMRFLGWGTMLISPRVWPAGSIVENNLKLKPSLLSKALSQGAFFDISVHVECKSSAHGFGSFSLLSLYPFLFWASGLSLLDCQPLESEGHVF